MWTPSHGRAKTGRPARTYIQQLCADTGCSPKDLLEAMDAREGQRYPRWWSDMMMMRMSLPFNHVPHIIIKGIVIWTVRWLQPGLSPYCLHYICNFTEFVCLSLNHTPHIRIKGVVIWAVGCLQPVLSTYSSLYICNSREFVGLLLSHVPHKII